MALDSGRMLSDDPTLVEIAIWVLGAVFSMMTGMLAFIVRREVRRNDTLAAKVAELDKFSIGEMDFVLFRAEFRDEFAKFRAEMRHDREESINRIDEINSNCAKIHAASAQSAYRSIEETARAAVKAAIESSNLHFRGE